MKKIILSIIIPTHRRINKLNLIIQKLLKQIPLNINTEIIVCDNEENIFYENLKNFNHKNLSIKYLFCSKNSNALKRNNGIKKAKGKNLILLDDDCLPANNFIIEYLNLFKQITDKDILCGSVKYLKKNINTKNFTRYRQTRHFVFPNKSINRKKYLEASKIVTMNMGMKNSKLLKKTKYFNNKFSNYGFEDYEFGYRLIKKGFNLIPSKPTVYHLDERNFRSYLNKIYFLSRYSTNVLKKINYKSWKQTIYFRIEDNLIFNFLTKLKIFYFLIEIFEKFIVYLEKYIFYIPRLYRLAIFLSYYRGYCDRKDKNKKNYHWYE